MSSRPRRRRPERDRHLAADDRADHLRGPQERGQPVPGQQQPLPRLDHRQLQPVLAPAVGARPAERRAAGARVPGRDRAGADRPPLQVPESLVPGVREPPVHDPLDRLLPDPAQRHRPRLLHRRGGADRVHAGADLPQRRHRPAGGAAGDGRRGGGHGAHAAPDPLQGRAADGAADDLRGPADRGLLDGRHRGLRVLRGRRRPGRRDLRRPDVPGQRRRGVGADGPARDGARAHRARRPALGHPLGAGGEPMILATLGPFGDAIDFIFHERESQAGTVRVGGLGEIWELTWTHLQLSLVATLVATLIALPLGVYLGHIGRFQFVSTSISNIGRAIPALGLVVFFIAFLGVGFLNVCVALVLLAIPPIITNSYVGVRGGAPDTVDAARGNGLTGRQVALQVELPMALPTIMGGIRISLVSVIATATIAPLANVDTLGRPIISPNVYGTAGQLAACIVVALVTFAADWVFASVQRAVTPRGLKVNTLSRSRGRFASLSPKRSIQST